MASSLLNRNVIANGRRTSVRLEREMWDALAEIAEREGQTVNDVCSDVYHIHRQSTLTSGIRVFILGYFRAAATQEGHVAAGHGRHRRP